MAGRSGLISPLLLLLASAARAAAPSVELSREGHVFRLEASFEASGSPSAAWDVLTDYDGMTRFVSSLRKSRVVRREADGVVIEQEGLARVLIFTRRVPMTLKVREFPPDRIEFAAAENPQFEEYDGQWEISPASGACRIGYRLFAEMKPSAVPRGMARRALETSVRGQLEQVRAEIERRAFSAPRRTP